MKPQDFFIIDRTKLDEVSDALYGYAIVGDRIILDDPSADFESSMYNGCFTAVRRAGNEITVLQDFMGCFGIYLYENNLGHYVISNSILFLEEYLAKKGLPFSVNRDYANYMIPVSLCSAASGQTILNEVRMLDRNARLVISLKSGEYRIETTDFQENTIPPDSYEGLMLLDRWFDRWVGLARRINSETANMIADLSGGFDTRMMFTLILESGIDLNKVSVHSIQDLRHTHEEDFEIASQIAERYQFPLNNWEYQNDTKKIYSMREYLECSLYPKLFFHKQMYYKDGRFEKTKFHFTGNGGGYIRRYWNSVPKGLISGQADRAGAYCGWNDTSLRDSTVRILEQSLRNTTKKFRGFGRELSDQDIVQAHYRETRCRNHFGRSMAESFLSNIVVLSPLLDPELHRLKLQADECDDENFLAALIFVRYNPALLDFPFEGGRSIAEQTIKAAERINTAYPRKKPELPPFTPADPEPVPNGDISLYFRPFMAEEGVQNALESDFIKDRVSSEFSSFLYEKLLQDSAKSNFYPLADCYPLLGMFKLLQDIESPGYLSVSMGEYLMHLSREKLISKEESSADVPPAALVEAVKSFRIQHAENHLPGIVIKWNTCEGADGYEIARKRSGENKKIAVLGADAVSFADTEVAEDCWGRVYTYSVQPLYRQIPVGKPGEIIIQRLRDVHVSEAVKTGSKVEIRWSCDPSANRAAGYEMEYALSHTDLMERKGSFRRRVFEGKETRSAVLNAKHSDDYYVRVRAFSVYTKGSTGESVRSVSSFSPVFRIPADRKNGFLKNPFLKR